MKLNDLPFGGHYEERSETVSETLQVVEPTNELEENVLAYAILPRTLTLDDADSARQGYTFTYDVGEHLERGIFRLRIGARDASGRDHAVEIGAVLTTSVTVPEETRRVEFVPMWLVSDRFHYEPLQDVEAYPGHCFGRLLVEAVEVLPHRRLFGATV